jgi:hypothetical protein
MDTGRDFEEASANAVERRQRPRYLFSETMTIRSAAGAAMPGISVEMSETGMSAMVKGLLQPGDTVELEPVAGGKTPAVVRHKLGRLYGFEFAGLSAEQAVRIAESCKKLTRYRRVRGA